MSSLLFCDPTSSSSHTHSSTPPTSLSLLPPPFSSVALPTVQDLKVFDETSTTMKVRWAEPVGGATGYMLRYVAVRTAEPLKEVIIVTSSIGPHPRLRFLMLAPPCRAASVA